jgi:hypothetical protein
MSKRWPQCNWIARQAVESQIGNRDHLQCMFPAKAGQIVHPCHSAVIVENFADHARRVQSGKTR